MVVHFSPISFGMNSFSKVCCVLREVFHKVCSVACGYVNIEQIANKDAQLLVEVK